MLRWIYFGGNNFDELLKEVRKIKGMKRKGKCIDKVYSFCGIGVKTLFGLVYKEEVDDLEELLW